MAKAVNDILFRFLGDTKSLDKATRGAKKNLTTTQKATSGLSKAAIALGGAFAATRVLDFAGDAIQLAVAAEEVESKFNTVFGASEDLRGSLEAWGDVAGITETAAKDMAATFGNLAIAQGISEDATQDLVLNVATLAGDMASFNDSDPEQVFFDLNKALLTTEREGMKKYGIAISETEVKQRALDIAVEDGRTEATKADRAYASYAIAVEQAGKANGDLARTADSTANKQRQLSASIKEMQEEIGKELLPVYEDLLGAFKLSLPLISDQVAEIGKLTDAYDTLANVGLAAATGASIDYKDTIKSVFDATLKLNPALWAIDEAWGLMGLSISDAAGFIEETADAMKSTAVDYAIYSDSILDMGTQAQIAARKVDDLGDAAVEGAPGQLVIDQWAKYAKAVGFVPDVPGSVAEPAPPPFVDPSHQRHAGGVVPGPRGREVSVTALGGERVTPMTGGGGGGSTVNITVNALDPVAAADAVVEAIRQYEATNGPIN